MDITSRENRLVKEYRHLLTEGKYRRETARFVLEGARLCGDAVLSGISVETVLYTARAKRLYTTVFDALAAVSPCFEITDELCDYLGDTASPQGLFCICRMPQTVYTLDTLSPIGNYAALETVQDPANLGAMIRTAEALGLDGLLLSDGCCDAYNPKVLRASMGGVFRLPLYAAGDLPCTLNELGNRGFTTVACVVDRTALPIQSAPLQNGSICVIGNEGNGLSPQAIAACTVSATIPMVGRAESLNASMAAGIVFWEMMRKDDNNCE